MMTRTAHALTGAGTLPAERVNELRDQFMRHCNKLREAKQLGDGEYPPLPDTVSALGRYTPERIDQIPFEQLETLAMEADANHDPAVCEVLCLEMERREDLAARYPQAVEEDERRRRAALTAAQRREWGMTRDPITTPTARHEMTATQLKKVVRAEYEAHVELEILRAEEECNGQLLNAAGKNALVTGRGFTMRALWTNHILAQNYASEELRRYWQEHPRMTFAAWEESTMGRFGEAQESVAKSSIISI